MPVDILAPARRALEQRFITKRQFLEIAASPCRSKADVLRLLERGYLLRPAELSLCRSKPEALPPASKSERRTRDDRRKVQRAGRVILPPDRRWAPELERRDGRDRRADRDAQAAAPGSPRAAKWALAAGASLAVVLLLVVVSLSIDSGRKTPPTHEARGAGGNPKPARARGRPAQDLEREIGSVPPSRGAEIIVDRLESRGPAYADQHIPVLEGMGDSTLPALLEAYGRAAWSASRIRRVLIRRAGGRPEVIETLVSRLERDSSPGRTAANNSELREALLDVAALESARARGGSRLALRLARLLDPGEADTRKSYLDQREALHDLLDMTDDAERKLGVAWMLQAVFERLGHEDTEDLESSGNTTGSVQDRPGEPSGSQVKATGLESPVSTGEGVPLPIETDPWNSGQSAYARGLEAGRAAAEERVANARQEIAAAEQRQAELWKARAARAIELTAERPLDFPVAGGCRATRVLSLDATGYSFEIQGPGRGHGKLTKFWNQHLDFSALVLATIAAPDDVDALWQAAGMFLKARRFDEAHRTYQRAVRAMPATRSPIPDFREIKRRLALFGTKVPSGRRKLTIRYPFRHGSELDDFKLGDTVAKVVDGRDGGLIVGGAKGVHHVRGGPLVFDGDLTIEFEVRAPDPGAYASFGVQLDNGLNGCTVLAGNGRAYLFLDRDGESEQVGERPYWAAPGSFRMKLSRGSVRLEDEAGKPLFRADLPPYTQVSPFLGLQHTDEVDSEVRYGPLLIEGQPSAFWLGKKQAETNDLILAALARRPGDSAGGSMLPQTSLDPVEAYAGSDSSRTALLAEVCRLLDGDIEHAKAAYGILEGATRTDPPDPLLEYWAAVAAVHVGEPMAAYEHAGRALAAFPEFMEALAIRAEFYVYAGLYEEAQSDADLVLSKLPDCAIAWRALGFLAFRQGHGEDAIAKLRLARKLRPDDAENRRMLSVVQHVLDGPDWEKPVRLASEHYELMTNVPADRAKDYLDRLDAARRMYVRFHGAPAEPRSSQALIFNTPEGFHIYAEITRRDRAENLAGYFQPIYNQLLLYEDAADIELDETHDTLQHEGFHQFASLRLPSLPVWANEGLAEVYGSAVPAPDGELSPGPLQEGRLQNLRYYAEDGEIVPFETIMALDRSAFYGDRADLCYAQAWAMVHWFRHDAPEELREAFGRYVEAFADPAADRQDVFDRTLGAMDLAVAEASFHSYLKTLGR